MANLPWSVYVRIGEHEWTIAHTPGDEQDDTVLDNLSFGWSMRPGLWPDQPQAMDAAFSLVVPYFPDYGDLTDGLPVVIEAKLDPPHGLAPPKQAAFYGRATDLVATPRDQTPDVTEPGVVIDCIAIDYTTDPAEYPDDDAVFTWVNTQVADWRAVRYFFERRGGGDLPNAGAAPFLWTSPSPVSLNPAVGTFTLSITQKLADDLLRQAVDWNDGSRMIYSPLIDGDGNLATGRTLTLDTISKAAASADPTLVLDAAQLDMNVKWAQAKGEVPEQVAVKINGAQTYSDPIVATATGATRPYSTVDLTAQLTDDADGAWIAGAIAAYYIPGAVDDFDRWAVRQVSWFIDQVDEDALEDIPLTLFPRWKDAEGDADRAACYGQVIAITGVREDAQPFSDGRDGTAGTLVGARFVLENGLPRFDLSLRFCRPYNEDA